jgi:hypothetical protein
MGSSERIFWYLFDGFLHVDNFVVELFFPAKMLEMSLGGGEPLFVCYLMQAVGMHSHGRYC